MAYGIIKVDTITFTDGGVDKSVSISGLVQNPTFSGNITVTGTISGNLVQGQTVSGVTVTGTTAAFTTGTFVSLTGTTIQGTTATYTTGSFASLTGTTTTGTTANFASGVFTTQISGATITGNSAAFTTVTGGTATITSGVFASGTAAAPSVSVGTTDNGIYSPGTDQVAISTNGTGRLFVGSAGNVTVGTGTTYGEFNVTSSDVTTDAFITEGTSPSSARIRNTSGILRLDADVFNTAASSALLFGVDGTERLRITSDGKVGLGTSSPSSVFEVTSTGVESLLGVKAVASRNAYLDLDADANRRAVIRFNSAGTAQWSIGRGDSDEISADSFHVSTGSSGGNTAKLVVTSGGNVGVGTTSPSSLLHVNGEARFGASEQLRLTASSTEAYIDALSSGGNLAFRTNAGAGAVERARIDSSGRLLVGTSGSLSVANITAGLQMHSVATNNGASLSLARFNNDTSGPQINLAKSRNATINAGTIVQDNDDLGTIHFAGDDGTDLNTSAARIQAFVDGTPGANDMPGRLVFSTTADGASSPTERMRIDSSGNVGVGTASPSAPLHIQDDGTDGLTNTGLIVSSYQPRIILNDRSSGQEYIDIRNDSTGGGAQLIIGYGPKDTFGTRTGEYARIDSSGRLLVGTSSAYNISGLAAPDIQLSRANTDAGIGVTAWKADSIAFNASLALMRSYNNTQGTHTALPDGAVLGVLRFAGSDGSVFRTGAEIKCAADGQAWASGDCPTRLVFSTTADLASTPTERMRINSSGAIGISNSTFLYPNTDNAVGLGFSGQRWSSVWAANGTIQTSDQRAKVDIATSTLGSDFIKSLRPVSYKWIEGGKVDTGERDEDGNYIYESVPGQRTHWGFIAQDVKEAVDAAGVDFGGWLLDDKDDPDSQQALRYDQFIAPLTKALQEALAEIDVLKAKVAALESA